MKPKIVFWFLFVCVISPPLCAQQNQKLDSILRHYSEKNKAIDSLVQVSEKKINDTLKVEALARLYNTFLYNTPALAARFARKELQISDKINYNKGKGWANYHLGAYYQNAGNIDSARYFLEHALQIQKSLGNNTSYASVLNSLASLNYLEGKYEKAIAQFDSLLAIYQKEEKLYAYAISLGEKANISIDKGHYQIALQETLAALKILDTVYKKPLRKADAQRQVGRIEFLRNNYENALIYFEQALAIYKEQKDNVYIANVTNDIGNVYYHLKKFKPAEAHLKTALELAKEHKISETEANTMYNLGKVYHEKGDYKKALDYLKDALFIHEENNYVVNIMSTENEIGRTYLSLNQPKNAIPFLNRTIKKALDKGPLKQLIYAYKLRSLAYKEMGALASSLSDKEKFIILNDSIFNSTKSQQVEELRILYETEKKEQQIALQEQEITVLEQKAEISNLQKLLMGIGLLLSVIGFYAIRQKMKRNKLEKEKVDAELEFKKKELTTHALNLARKNETLENLKMKAQELKETENTSTGYNQLIRSINFDLQDDNNWENFSRYFEEVHKDFNSNIKNKYPEVTSNELRLLALLKMNLSSKEIANILNISAEGIKKARYRLRKKLDLTTEDSLQDLVLSL